MISARDSSHKYKPQGVKLLSFVTTGKAAEAHQQSILCGARLPAGPGRELDQKLGEEGFNGRERLQDDGRKRRRGKRLEMLMHAVSSASGARHRCKESWRRKETLRYHLPVNSRQYRTPARAQTCAGRRFHFIDLLILDREGGLNPPLSSRAGPAAQAVPTVTL